jgi:CDP-diacylglycerol--serine O-phosphatidyltransferase
MPVTMAESITQALILSFPLVVSGGLHMAVVTLDLLPGLKIPLHRGWFGRNKTWRGLIVMPVTTAVSVALASMWWPQHFGGRNPVVFGIILGLAYALAELPNSFVKRRLGIEPGKRPPRHAAWFALVDQADSAIGCALVYGWALRLTPGTILLLIAIGPAIHLMVNYNLYLMRLRKEPL